MLNDFVLIEDWDGEKEEGEEEGEEEVDFTDESLEALKYIHATRTAMAPTLIHI